MAQNAPPPALSERLQKLHLRLALDAASAGMVVEAQHFNATLRAEPRQERQAEAAD